MTEMSVLKLSYGDQTDDLLEFVLAELDDATLDDINIEREFSKPEGLASEPITVAAVLTLSGVLIVVVGRIIERWMEGTRQDKQLKALQEALEKSQKDGHIVKELFISQNEVSATLGGLPDIPSI